VALTWWRKGITTATHVRRDILGEIDYDEDWRTEKLPEREKADLRVVRVQLLWLRAEAK